MHDKLINDKVVDQALEEITPEDKPQEQLNALEKSKTARLSIRSAINTTVNKQLSQALRNIQ